MAVALPGKGGCPRRSSPLLFLGRGEWLISPELRLTPAGEHHAMSGPPSDGPAWSGPPPGGCCGFSGAISGGSGNGGTAPLVLINEGQRFLRWPDWRTGGLRSFDPPLEKERMPLNRPITPGSNPALHLPRRRFLLTAVALVAGALWLLLRGASPPAALAAAGFTAPVAVSASAPEIMYSAFLGDHTDLWAATPEALQRPRRIATVPHAEGFGLRASVSPNGRHISYLALPRGAYDPAAQGVLWLMGTDGSGGRALADGLDAVRAPVWSPDGRWVAVRQAHPGAGDGKAYSLAVVDVERGRVSTLLPPLAVDGIYPFGWSTDSGSVFVAVIAGAGTDFLRVTMDGDGIIVAHASDGIARDFRLAPDGTRVVYNEIPQTTASDFRLLMVETGNGQVTELHRSPNPMLGPAWQPNGGGVIAGPGPGPAGSIAGGLARFNIDGASWGPSPALPPGTFAVPMGWSGNGRWLALQQLTGSDLNRITSFGLALLDQTNGRMTPLTSPGYLEFIGWSGGG